MRCNDTHDPHQHGIFYSHQFDPPQAFRARDELRADGPQRFTVHINPELLKWLSLSLALHTITDILYRQPLMT